MAGAKRRWGRFVFDGTSRLVSGRRRPIPSDPSFRKLGPGSVSFRMLDRHAPVRLGVCGGTAPLAGRRNDLIETIPAGPDHAGARKDDRYKQFAARASSQVMFALMERLVVPTKSGRR